MSNTLQNAPPNAPASPRGHAFAFLDHPGPIAYAHRGGGSEAEENTRAAIVHAVDLGFRYIETDVQATRDGVAVLFHDDDLARMTGTSGRISDLDFAELATRRTAGGEPIPRLDAILDAFPRIRFNLEPKTEDAVEPLAEAVRRCGAIDRVCVGCFDVRRTMRARALLGERLCWSPSRGGVARVWLAGFGAPVGRVDFPVLQIPPGYGAVPLVTRRLLAAAHARGIAVHVWTIDEEAEMERLLDLNVDGLMTGRPSLLKRVLERRGAWYPA